MIAAGKCVHGNRGTLTGAQLKVRGKSRVSCRESHGVCGCAAVGPVIKYIIVVVRALRRRGNFSIKSNYAEYLRGRVHGRTIYVYIQSSGAGLERNRRMTRVYIGRGSSRQAIAVCTRYTNLIPNIRVRFPRGRNSKRTIFCLDWSKKWMNVVVMMKQYFGGKVRVGQIKPCTIFTVRAIQNSIAGIKQRVVQRRTKIRSINSREN